MPLALVIRAAVQALFRFSGLGRRRWGDQIRCIKIIVASNANDAITIIVCLAWPRPLVVGGALMVFGSALEGLQAFTPDRSSGGALSAALIAELLMRAFSSKSQAAHI